MSLFVCFEKGQLVMAATVTRPAGQGAIQADLVIGNKRARYRTVTFDSSYPTGGYSLTPQQVGMRMRIEQVNVLSNARTSSGTTSQTCSWDPVNQKLQVYNGDAGAAGPNGEVANTTNLSTFSVPVQFIGV